MRELVKIVTLDDVIEHTNADALELGIIGGWQVCVRKGEFKKGDEVVYFEVDSLLPLTNPIFETFAGRNDVTHEGVVYARIRTMKLRKELSQGLVLPLSILDGMDTSESPSEFLGVVKYEPKMPACLAGEAKGMFPSFIKKTDQVRIQNFSRLYNDLVCEGHEYEVTYKLDGSSMTAYHMVDEDGTKSGVCSRNLDLKTSESNDGNSFVQTYRKLDIANRLEEFYEATGVSIAIQGELIGDSIQGNFERVDCIQFHVFSVYNIDTQSYMLPHAAQNIVENILGLTYIPVLHNRYTPTESVTELLEMAEGEGAFGAKYREGLVFKSLTDPELSFKVISNSYLMKEQ